MTSPSPSPGELWLAYLHFSDMPELGKVRPVLVLAVGEGRAVAAKVTSKDVGASLGAPAWPVPGWEALGLRRPSFVRLDQRFEIPFGDLLRGEPLGALPPGLFSEVSALLSGLGG